MSTTMTYGSYTFSPVPMINLSRQWRDITADGLSGNFHHSLTLQGTLTPLPDNIGSIVAIDILQQQMMSGLHGCGPLVLSCGGTELLNVYPKVNNIQFSPTSNNWVNTCDYTIEMTFEEMDNVDSDYVRYIESFTENWDFTIQDSPNTYYLTYAGITDQVAGHDYTNETGTNWFSITHTMGVQCSAACHDGGKRAGYLDGFDVIAENFGEDAALWDKSHLNVHLSGMNQYNHMRSTSIDQAGGTFNMTESWVVAPNTGGAIETFNLTVQSTVDNPITRVNIDGAIQGLEIRDWGTTGVFDQSVTSHKYNNALSYWQNTVSKRIYPRCQLAAIGAASRSLHPTYIDHSVAHNITDGAISYNYSFDDRGLECVDGALYESIVITDTNSSDIFAQIIIPGRVLGPILQDAGTVTASSRNVSVEVVVPISTGCTAATILSAAPSAAVTTLLTSFQTNLTDNYGQVFKSRDSENWNPKTGRYSREVEWTYQDCS